MQWHVELTLPTSTVLYRMTCLECSLHTSTVSDELRVQAAPAPHTRCSRNARFVPHDLFLLRLQLRDVSLKFYNMTQYHSFPSLLLHCWLGVRKGIWPVETCIPYLQRFSSGRGGKETKGKWLIQIHLEKWPLMVVIQYHSSS